MKKLIAATTVLLCLSLNALADTKPEYPNRPQGKFFDWLRKPSNETPVSAGLVTLNGLGLSVTAAAIGAADAAPLGAIFLAFLSMEPLHLYLERGEMSKELPFQHGRKIFKDKAFGYAVYSSLGALTIGAAMIGGPNLQPQLYTIGAAMMATLLSGSKNDQNPADVILGTTDSSKAMFSSARNQALRAMAEVQDDAATYLASPDAELSPRLEQAVLNIRSNLKLDSDTASDADLVRVIILSHAVLVST